MPTKKLSDSEILSLLGSDVKAGVKYSDTKLASERARVDKYYNGQLPAPFHAGNSKYVSTDVYDTVESAKAVLLETFSAHGDIVQFSPKGEEDIELARVSTAYVKHVVFELNKGTDLFANIIHGSLTHRNAVAKVYWDECNEPCEETFDDYDDDMLDELLNDEEVEVTDITQDEDETGLWSGTLVRKNDRSQVRIEALPMEEFIVRPNIRCLATGYPITHRSEKSKDELIEAGFDEAKVKALSSGRDNELEQDYGRLTRLQPVGGDFVTEDPSDRQEETRKHLVYETYTKANLDGTTVKLWKIVWCGGAILDKEQVSRHPFFSYAALPTPHRFWGENFAARVIPTQNAKTVLIRSILDHAVVANNPRIGVVKGALTNPRELLDNRLGGLVNVTRPDGIFPLPQAPLNPFVFQTIGMLDEDKEDVTGVSRLSQGLNKDAISNQNSQGMVEQLIGASMQRQKTMARAFASQFLGPVFLEVYRLAVENEKRQKIIDIGGSYVPVNPSDWTLQRDVVIDFRLGYGERDERAKEYLEMGQLLGQDPTIQHLFTPTERYNLYKISFETKGHRDISMFLKDPAKTEPPQPDPKAALELKAMEQELDMNERKQKLSETKTSVEIKMDQFLADMKQRFDTMDYMLKVREEHRKELETDNKIAVAREEMALAQEATELAPPANVKSSAIISPNG